MNSFIFTSLIGLSRPIAELQQEEPTRWNKNAVKRALEIPFKWKKKTKSNQIIEEAKRNRGSEEEAPHMAVKAVEKEIYKSVKVQISEPTWRVSVALVELFPPADEITWNQRHKIVNLWLPQQCGFPADSLPNPLSLSSITNIHLIRQTRQIWIAYSIQLAEPVTHQLNLWLLFIFVSSLGDRKPIGANGCTRPSFYKFKLRVNTTLDDIWSLLLWYLSIVLRLLAFFPFLNLLSVQS